MYRLALSLVRRSDEAEDIVQDIGMRLWERRTEMENVRNVETYVMNAVKNKCLDYLRSAGKTSDLTECASIPYEQTPYQNMEQADMMTFIRMLINRLPLQQQMTIRLRDVEGYELDEIADILDTNEGAVRSNLSRARQKIRENLLKIHHYGYK
jgi:RNA polymerase sigma-70 factor (ECF subfamily)